jgi:hypothetical protein
VNKGKTNKTLLRKQTINQYLVLLNNIAGLSTSLESLHEICALRLTFVTTQLLGTKKEFRAQNESKVKLNFFHLWESNVPLPKPPNLSPMTNVLTLSCPSGHAESCTGGQKQAPENSELA